MVYYFLKHKKSGDIIYVTYNQPDTLSFWGCNLNSPSLRLKQYLKSVFEPCDTSIARLFLKEESYYHGERNSEKAQFSFDPKERFVAVREKLTSPIVEEDKEMVALWPGTNLQVARGSGPWKERYDSLEFAKLVLPRRI